MLTIDDTVLYEEFLAARERAIAITDRYSATSPTDPARADLWDNVMRQTETARLLLERWLKAGKLHD